VARLLAVAAALALGGCGGETVTVTTIKTVTETTTATVTDTVTEAQVVGLPDEVNSKHSALLEAARSGEYKALKPLIPDQFSYSFGGPFDGGPIAYWKFVEKQSGNRPIEILARILDMPYTLYRGTYVWPFAYDKQPDELTVYERRILGDLADDFGAGTGYLGWRAGIERDGTWSFFIAGD
jgi:uncharacterized protein YceK